MVIRNEVSEKTRFKDMKLEDVFMYNGKCYMKVSDENSEESDDFNAYDFNTHQLTNFPPEAEVERYKAELVIYGKDAVLK